MGRVTASDSRHRILEGALACLKDAGITRFSLQRASGHAGVSKALVLYHFASRATLLDALTGWLTDRVTTRERNAIDEQAQVSVLDALWTYLAEEHALGEYAVLLTLAGSGLAELHAAVGRSAEQRRSHAARTLETVYQRLRLSPRLPWPQITEVEQAFRDGLLARMNQGGAKHPRAVFDVFWLALLNQSA